MGCCSSREKPYTRYPDPTLPPEYSVNEDKLVVDKAGKLVLGPEGKPQKFYPHQDEESDDEGDGLLGVAAVVGGAVAGAVIEDELEKAMDDGSDDD